MINPFDIPDDETAQRIAERRTERLRDREGMFSEFIDPVTAEQIQEAAHQHREHSRRRWILFKHVAKNSRRGSQRW